MRARRIVFAFDARLRRVGALEALAALAEQMQAELVGLFIEDIDLLHLAALPFAREIGYPSAAHRELDLTRMQRSLTAYANELRRTCEAVLKDTPVTWSFRVARGSRTEQLMNAAIEGRAPTLLIPPGIDPHAEPVVVSLSELTEESSQALFDSAQRPILILP
jgi:hypothetical protein